MSSLLATSSSRFYSMTALWRRTLIPLAPSATVRCNFQLSGKVGKNFRRGYQQHRFFFWGSGENSSNDDGDDRDEKDDKDKRKGQNSDQTPFSSSSSSSAPSSSSSSSFSDPPDGKNEPSSFATTYATSADTTVGATGDDSSVLATVGQGDDAPTPSPLITLPLAGRPLFPGMVHGLIVSHPPTVAALRDLEEKPGAIGPYVGVFLRKDMGANIPEVSFPEVISDPQEIYSVGTLAQIHNVQNALRTNSGDTIEQPMQIFLTLHRRINFLEVVKMGPPMLSSVEHWSRGEPLDASDVNHPVLQALVNEIVVVIRDIVRMNPLFREHTQYFTSRVDISNPYKLADFAASLTTADGPELQAVLEERNAKERLRKALELVTKEREMSKIQQEIQKQVEAKISDTQREYFLNEQLKSIKKELGHEKDDKEALLAKFESRLADAVGLPDTARSVIDDELAKLKMLEKNSPEFNTTSSYLDWLTQLPWGRLTTENFDIMRARKILDSDHYGLDDVKERILEFIAVGRLRGTVQGKIICLVGPPGVGKTSIGKSVAQALNREFYRFSVGGLSDVAEIKGHRRTYIGAMPGKPIQCLKETQSSNPLILIDEIDKLGRGHQGDPASALLELLDPGQNATFSDHYIDTPVDISQALFLCTANVLDTIPGPLLDRMEIVRLSGYDLREKVEIAKQYLIPKALHDAGLTSKETEDQNAEMDEKNESEEKSNVGLSGSTPPLPVNIPDGLGIDNTAIYALVRWYCREAGVRQLAQRLERICRQLALDVVRYAETGDVETKGAETKWLVTEDSLESFAGKPVFTSDRLYDEATPPGVVMGLAWTAMGGSSLYIECQSVPSSPRKTDTSDSSGSEATGAGGGKIGRLMTTGQMGDVMQESSNIAYSFARFYLQNHVSGQSENCFLAEETLHMHVPEGATPKDGPSAGVTMVTAMLSLAMGRPIRPDLAMTGEISLTGKVLPVGGIKEKVIAARRAAITCLALPIGCRRDFEELPEYLRDGLEVHFASTYNDIYAVAFCEEPNSPFAFDL